MGAPCLRYFGFSQLEALKRRTARAQPSLKVLRLDVTVLVGLANARGDLSLLRDRLQVHGAFGAAQEILVCQEPRDGEQREA